MEPTLPLEDRPLIHTRSIAHPLALAACLLSGCATVTPPPAAEPAYGDLEVATRGTGPDPAAAPEYHVLAGELAAARGEPLLAARHLALALERYGEPKLAARAAGLALAGGDEPLALRMAERWAQLAPRERNALSVLLRLQLRAGDDRAADTARQLLALAEEPGQGLRDVAHTMAQEEAHLDAALQVMETLAAEHADAPQAWIGVALIARRAEDFARAERAARRALALDPTSEDAGLLLAGALLSQGRGDEADATVTAMLQASDDAAHLALRWARMLLEAGEREQAHAVLERAVAAEPQASEPRYVLSLLLLEQGQVAAAREHLERVLASGERRSEAAWYLGRIAEMEGRLEQALDYYAQVTTGNQALEAAARRAAILGRLGRVLEARTLFARLKARYPDLAIQLTLSEAQMLIDIGDPPQALDLLDAALEQFPDDRDLRYSRALALEAAGRVDEAERVLRQLLAEQEDDARVLNALGYMLTVHSDRLAEARALIERAYALEPDDAAIIDSLGWVRFRMGELDAALELLARAWQQGPHPEIGAHYGEALWVAGRRDEAREVWRRALQLDGDHAVLRETIRRLTGE